MKRPDWHALVPLGYDPLPELRGFIVLSLGALVYSCSFFMRLYNSYSSMFSYHWISENELQKTLDATALMPRFPKLLDGVFLFFLMPAAFALVTIVLHYAHHWQGSKSIYLMRRLPDRWLLHRRCLTLPAAGLAVTSLALLVLTIVFYGLYRLVTPPGCLPAYHWMNY